MGDINKTQRGGENFPLVTPENALAYLETKGTVKVKKKSVNFLAIRKKLIPNCFGAAEFCDLVNKAKKAKFDGATFRDAVNGTFGNLLYEKLKDTHNITFDEVNALIGTLFNVFKVREEKEKIQKTAQASVGKAIDPDVEEIKYIRTLLRKVIGAKYKVFVARFFSDMKQYDEPNIENVVDVITKLMKDKEFSIQDTEDNITELVDCLERMRSIKQRKTKKKL